MRFHSRTLFFGSPKNEISDHDEGKYSKKKIKLFFGERHFDYHELKV